MHENLNSVGIPFDSVLWGNIWHENLNIFSIPFDSILSSHILHENLKIVELLKMRDKKIENSLKEIHSFALSFNPSRATG